MIHPSASRLLQSLFLCSVQVCLSSAATDVQPECLLFPALENKDQAFHCPAVTVLQIFLAGLPPIRNDYSVVYLIWLSVQMLHSTRMAILILPWKQFMFVRAANPGFDGLPSYASPCCGASVPKARRGFVSHHWRLYQKSVGDLMNESSLCWLLFSLHLKLHPVPECVAAGLTSQLNTAWWL